MHSPTGIDYLANMVGLTGIGLSRDRSRNTSGPPVESADIHAECTSLRDCMPEATLHPFERLDVPNNDSVALVTHAHHCGTMFSDVQG